MPLAITAQTIFERMQTALQLHWHYGQHIDAPSIKPTEKRFGAFAGFFSYLHPQQITLFGAEEIHYLENLSTRSYNQALRALFAGDLCMLLIAEGQEVPARLLSRAKRHRIPVLSAPLAGQLLIDKLNKELRSAFAKSATLHGVFMDVLGVGVLLTGKSGVGKSELALGLINCGHRLVADDAVIFSLVAQNTLIGSCPKALQDFLEVRGLGVINIRAMFGDNSVKDNKRLQLIVKVVSMENEQLCRVDRLEGIHAKRDILGVAIPEVTLPVAPGRNLAVLVEGAVRNQILKLTGYEASQDFITRQQKLIEEENL